MHEITLIKTIAYALVAALFFALIAKRLGLQPLVGYLIAGVAIGPFTPGFVGDTVLASQLAEIGVILLMFGVGLHFHLKDLIAVKRIAIPGALVQIMAATLFGLIIGVAADWTISAGLVLGIATSVASTVVLLKVLIDHQVLNTSQGHIAVGWLIVEDIVTILVLVLLPILAVSGAGEVGIFKAVLLIILKFALLCVIVIIAGGRLVPLLLTSVARLRSQEIFTLSILVLSISVAAFSYFAFGTSMALGAFLAGMVVGQTSVSHQAASDLLPMRDAFAVLFFVSVGMLFDYRVVLEYPWLTFGVLAIVLIVKPIAALLIVLILRYPLKTGLTVAAALAQIGEFSFIVAEVATRLDIMPRHAQSVLVAVAIVSITLNSYIFKFLIDLEPYLLRIPFIKKLSDKQEKERINSLSIQEIDPNSKDKLKAIIVGYGIVGRTLAKAFQKLGVEPIIIESNIDTVLEIKATGNQAIFGDATRKDILEQSGIYGASYVVITVASIQITTAVLRTISRIKSDIVIFARCHYERDRVHLINAGAVAVASEEVLVSKAMAENVLEIGMNSKVKIRKEVNEIHEQIKMEIGNLKF